MNKVKFWMDEQLYGIVLGAIKIEREDICGSSDPQMPISEKEDAFLPQIGFVGEGYRPRGTVLLGINPGGGSDSYRKTAQDSQLLPLIRNLREQEASSEALTAMFKVYEANMRTWNLWRVAGPVLEACGSNQSDIAYLNWCPFRTRNDQAPNASTMRHSYNSYLAPLLQALEPSRVIALGKAVGNWLEKVSATGISRYVVPRTRGDRSMSPEALTVIESIRRSS